MWSVCVCHQALKYAKMVWKSRLVGALQSEIMEHFHSLDPAYIIYKVNIRYVEILMLKPNSIILHQPLCIII